ncbi:protein regulator of cytokinesis 1-like [Bacillus rossius redtenbacheri]|uniref:protein regulator of cytokinesis 1-like n=1 Tax=Bacillus rossius redtenbacheri TaxID=93214 RepID=UPI002FDEF208
MSERILYPGAANIETIVKNVKIGFETLENAWQHRGYDEEKRRIERRKVEIRIVALIQEVIEENTFDSKATIKKENFSEENLLENMDNKMFLENCCVKKEITKQEDSLCEPLEESFLDIQLLEEKLKQLKAFAKEKEKGKEVILQAYSLVKEAVDNIEKEIDWAKSLSFEHKLIGNSISVFTKESKEKLESFHKKLEDQLKNRKIMPQNIITKLSPVWQSLENDICDRKEFFANLNSCAGLAITALTEELSCLEEVRKSKFEQFVQLLRKELDCWWWKCFYSEEQKKEFLPYYSSDYSEELLRLHEQQLEKVKKFYNDNISIFKLVHQRQKLWDMMIDIENKAYDPSRLFDNRGGQLLQEEKEKRMVQKDLPKIEEELLKQSKTYKQQNGHDFLIHGCALADVLKQQKVDYQKSKEQKRQERKLAREQEATAGVSSVTKSNCRKRKLCDTPSADITNSKKPLLRSATRASSNGKILLPIQNTLKNHKVAKKVLAMSGPTSQGIVN